MAYSPTRGLLDLFSGQEDIKHRLLRTVGAPEQRFAEDALRILRMYRFDESFDSRQFDEFGRICIIRMHRINENLDTRKND